MAWWVVVASVGHGTNGKLPHGPPTPHTPKSPKLAPNGPGTPNIGFLVSVSPHMDTVRGRGAVIVSMFNHVSVWPSGFPSHLMMGLVRLCWPGPGNLMMGLVS